MTRLNLMWYNSIRLVSRKHVVYFALTTLNNCRSGLVKRLPFVQINESIYVCCIIYMYEDDTLKWLKRLKDGQWYTTRLLLFLISLKHYAQEKQTDKERYKFNYLFYFYGSHYAGSRRTATQPLSHTQHISHRDARAHITSTQPTAVTGATQIQVLFPHYPTFSTRPPVDDTENLIVRAVCQAGNWCRNSWKKSEHGEYGESPAAVTATNKAWTNQLRIKIKIGSLIPRSGFRFLITWPLYTHWSYDVSARARGWWMQPTDTRGSCNVRKQVCQFCFVNQVCDSCADSWSCSGGLGEGSTGAFATLTLVYATL